MYMISNTDDVIDSRDVIARIEELQGLEMLSSEEANELKALKALENEADSSPDWSCGEMLIHDSYFVKYTEQLIDDCYDMPKDMNSGAWPWRHLKLDYEAAAQDLKADYFSVDFDGETYWIRA